MASPQDSQKIRSRNKYEMWDHDPGDTAANVVTPDGGTIERWFAMADYNNFAVGAMSSTLNGNGISKLEIVAAEDDSGTNTVVIKDSGAVVADAVGDWLIEECSAAEIRQEGNDESTVRNLTHVAGRITMADGADEAVVFYVGANPRFIKDNLTPETTIA